MVIRGFSSMLLVLLVLILFACYDDGKLRGFLGRYETDSPSYKGSII